MIIIGSSLLFGPPCTVYSSLRGTDRPTAAIVSASKKRLSSGNHAIEYNVISLKCENAPYTVCEVKTIYAYN